MATSETGYGGLEYQPVSILKLLSKNESRYYHSSRFKTAVLPCKLNSNFRYLILVLAFLFLKLNFVVYSKVEFSSLPISLAR